MTHHVKSQGEGGTMHQSPENSFFFICIGNACRSQMAEGFARHLSKKETQVFSAGSQPAGFVAPLAMEVMAEKGIDISKHYSKSVDEIPNQTFDVIITMGCGDACPYLKGHRRLDWEIADPIGESKEFFRRVRDEIEEEVRLLLGLSLKDDF